MNNHRKLWAVSGLIAALSLSGCWSSNNDDDPVPPPPPVSTEVPDSAGLSTAAFVSFILGLNANDESSEPLTIKDAFAVPAEETADPTPLT